MPDNTSPKEEGDELAQKLEKCESEKNEYLDGWRRAKADLANYRNEEMNRLGEVVKFGNQEILKELIVILDHLDLAIASQEKAGTADKGIYLIKAQCADMLKKYGVERIQVKPSTPFDPAFHEAMAEIESDQPPGSVVEEIEAGYTLHGKVLRASRVKVSK